LHKKRAAPKSDSFPTITMKKSYRLSSQIRIS
jgi:hypothetical protein